ncbi:thioredoxin family protein [Sulfurivermis fontis]|uniref:thioredoxin family protein n=1 Tax=Sulfurivermis fontis TaxID=1972068 RepID=UPI000FD7C2B2|nr:thioredoxin family protein [Sulfurivermis fontis]
MDNKRRIAVVATVLLAVAAVLVLKPRNETTAVNTPATALPQLVDLGATTCIPCRMMAPILDQLREDFAGRFEVHFIDVWLHPDAGKQYGMRVIPTQIFFDAQGRELFRHEGFYSREQILGKWQELGYDFGVTEATR